MGERAVKSVESYTWEGAMEVGLESLSIWWLSDFV
jgi:hypothetical protein